jgi:hypothetical protein
MTRRAPAGTQSDPFSPFVPRPVRITGPGAGGPDASRNWLTVGNSKSVRDACPGEYVAPIVLRRDDLRREIHVVTANSGWTSAQPVIDR